jgi:hypothetical protein
MRTYLGISSKRAALAGAIIAFFISALVVQTSFLESKRLLKPSAGTAPAAGAKVTLTPVAGTGAATAPVSAITATDGSFSLSGLVTGHYTLTITPAMTVTTSGQSTTPPFQAWANFKMLRGLTVNNIVANTAPTGPIAVMTNGSLNVIVFTFGGRGSTSTINGTLTK